MSRNDAILDMCMDSGLVVQSGDGWTCLECHASAKSPLDLAHAPACMLGGLLVRAMRSLPPDDPLSGDKVAETIASTPMDIRAKVDAVVEELCLAGTPERRMPAICRIRSMCPHIDETTLTALAFNGVPGDKGRHVLRMMLMRQAARVEPYRDINDRIHELKDKYMAAVDGLLHEALTKFTHGV